MLFPYFKTTMLGVTNERIDLADVTLNIFSHINKKADSLDWLYGEEEHLSKHSICAPFGPSHFDRVMVGSHR